MEESGEVFRSFSWTLPHGHCLAGYFNSNKEAEWYSDRLLHNLKIDGTKDHVFFQRNNEKFKAELEGAEVPLSQLHYRGAGSEDPHKAGHTVETRALLEMLRQACAKIALSGIQRGRVSCNFVSDVDSSPIALSLDFFEDGSTRSLADLENLHKGASKGWDKLSQHAWCGRKLSTTLQQTNLWDIYLFLIWSKHNPSSKIWEQFSVHLYPKVVFLAGYLLEAYVDELANLPLAPLPLLKTKHGNSRRVPKVNKIILLQRVKAQKRHRGEVMQTHTDLAPPQIALVRAEANLEVAEYVKLLTTAFADTQHVQVSWDASTYDVETLVAIAYDYKKNVSGYLPIQNISPVQTAELHETVRTLAVQGRITRVESYNTMRSFSHALNSIGLPLAAFAKPPDLLLGPLRAEEERVLMNGTYFIYNTTTQSIQRQVPTAWSLAKQPLLISVSDQGPLNCPGLDHLQFKLRGFVLPLYDQSHRTWNDLKSAMRSVKLFRILLQFSILYNMNYGPGGTKAWMAKKQQYAEEFRAKQTADGQIFLSYMPYICHEMGLSEPTTAEEREALFGTITSLQTLQQHGPLVKLMRWFSYFQSHQFYAGEHFWTKMLIGEGGPPQQGIQPEAVLTPDILAGNLDDREELRQLKLKMGSWRLAPLLVTPWTWWKNAQQLKLPHEIAGDIAKRAGTKLWAEEIHAVIGNGFFDGPQKLYPARFLSNEEEGQCISLHFRRRVQSSASYYLRPPFRYAGALLAESRETTLRQMHADWAAVLKAEKAMAGGAGMEPLKEMHWRLNSVNRLIHLIRDMAEVASTTAERRAYNNQVVELLTFVSTHLADTVIVENTHQMAKDALRDARHFQKSRTGKQVACIRCSAIPSRGVPCLKVSDDQKATASAGKSSSFDKLTHPNTHALKKEFQRLMETKTKQHTWPSTTQQMEWQQVVATEWFLCYMQDGDKFAAGPNSAWLSVLAGAAGEVVACQRAGEIMLILAVGSYGFAAWDLELAAGVRTAAGMSAFRPYRHNAIRFHHITELEDWVSVPVKPGLSGPHGPLHLEQTSEAMSLPLARIHAGLNLTCKQCQDLLALFKVNFRKNQSRASLHGLILDLFLETEHEKEEARRKMAACLLPQEEEHAEDSDMEELLEQLEDLENQGDPEIQKEKEKIKQRRTGRIAVPRAAGPDEGEQVPKRKAKAKAPPKQRKKGLLEPKMKAHLGHGFTG
ncbi:unnamed protein product [Symbiodinium sp. CCMP2592]|nr:unnamed protein product [Symbiodinium sp. CCMP2592]